MKSRSRDMRKSAIVSRYQRLSLVEKRTQSVTRMREPATRCPDCKAQVMPMDLLAHLDRCTGPREPGPGSRWVGWSEAHALGVPEGTLKRWVDEGRVRFRGDRGERQYLHGDLVEEIAYRKRKRRRYFRFWK